ncbi:MAG: signal recognition particle-docking protein FtsY [Deltaproteobacteria bacterium]|jgi:fused signal recognition particle receptor|nr:signal recognition particle-docking protein FtsY [Deltaproteobacteria bacterium]
MIFSKKKKEEKKKQKEQLKKQEEKAQEIDEAILIKEQELKLKEKPLSKDITDPNQSEEKASLFKRFKLGVAKTKNLLMGSLNDLEGEEAIDDDFIEDLEERLLAADMGFTTTEKIIQIVETKTKNLEIRNQSEAIKTVQDVITQILDQGDHFLPAADSGPTVYLFVGVNGVGKTTSIGKLAARFKKEGKKVLLAAGDTFRAAAIEQLVEWGKRAEVDIVANKINSDPAATIYEAASKAVNENYDVLLCDTSGRLHTKKNLMDELYKMQKVLTKVIPAGPHASILVLDANTGQNAINQTKEFTNLIGLHGLIVTKLDGTAKGGVIIGIVNEFEIPVFYVGVGEGINDLQHFSPRLFSESLFE